MPQAGKGLGTESLQSHSVLLTILSRPTLGKEGKISVVANWTPSPLLD